MPHLDLTEEELDRLYPSLIPPDDEQLDDLANDRNDVVYQKGLQLAEAIRDETSLQGRMRRPLIAELQEQQQHDGCSKQDRTRTIRPFGGGVISAATTIHTTATSTTPTLRYATINCNCNVSNTRWTDIGKEQDVIEMPEVKDVQNLRHAMTSRSDRGQIQAPSGSVVLAQIIAAQKAIQLSFSK